MFKHAPTSSYSDEEIESFYECLKETCGKGRDCFCIGDFNYKVRAYKEGDTVVDKYGMDDRNGRGEGLVQFSKYMGTPIMNIFF